MENRRVALEAKEKEISQIEQANFIMLSLYRNYAILAQNNPADKEKYFSKMRQIKQDLKHLASKELLSKAQKVYLPVLQKMEN